MPTLLQKLRQMPPWQRMMFILAFAQFVTSLGFSNIFPFLPFYLESLGSKTTLSIEFLVGLVFSAQATTMVFAAPIWGAIADRYGRKLMVERAMFGGAIIFFLMGFARSAEDVIALRALQGLVTGVVAAVNALLVATVPRERTGYAIGIIQVSRWGGISIGPLMGGLVADHYGYRPTFFITTALLLTAGSLVFWGVDENFTPSETSKVNRSGIWKSWKTILQTKGIRFSYLIEFLNSFSRMIFLPLVPLFAKLLLDNTERASSFTGLVLGVSAAAGIAGSVYLGQLGDQIGHRKILITSAFIAAILYFSQAFVTQAWQFLFFQILTGITLGGILPALGALLAQYTQHGKEGSVYGLDNAIVAIARGLAPLAGAGMAYFFNIRASIILTGIMLVITALIALWKLPEIKSVPNPSAS